MRRGMSAAELIRQDVLDLHPEPPRPPCPIPPRLLILACSATKAAGEIPCCRSSDERAFRRWDLTFPGLAWFETHQRPQLVDCGPTGFREAGNDSCRCLGRSAFPKGMVFWESKLGPAVHRDIASCQRGKSVT